MIARVVEREFGRSRMNGEKARKFDLRCVIDVCDITKKATETEKVRAVSSRNFKEAGRLAAEGKTSCERREILKQQLDNWHAV